MKQQREIGPDELSLPAILMDWIRDHPHYTAQARGEGGWDFYLGGKWCGGCKKSHPQYALSCIKACHFFNTCLSTA